MSAYFDNPSDDPSGDARRAILAAALRHVPFDGWTDKTLRRAVSDCDLPRGAQALYFPGGAAELLRFWAEQINQIAAEKIKNTDWTDIRIRDRITQSVLIWLDGFKGREDQARRALSRLSLPDKAGQGPGQLWDSADMIWRAIGDTSTDGNFYSKRLILSGVLASTLLSWLSDNSEDKSKAKAFLDRRIDNVMRFEKTKWQWRETRKNWPAPAEILGKLRYGSFRRRRRRY